MSSQDKIHKVDMSDKSISIIGQIDLVLSDMMEQITLIVECDDAGERNTRISMMRE